MLTLKFISQKESINKASHSHYALTIRFKKDVLFLVDGDVSRLFDYEKNEIFLDSFEPMSQQKWRIK